VEFSIGSAAQSPAISAGSGLFTMVLLGYAFGFIVYFFVGENNITMYWPLGFAIALSLASFIGGTWYYLRRVEP